MQFQKGNGHFAGGHHMAAIQFLVILNSCEMFAMSILMVGK